MLSIVNLLAFLTVTGYSIYLIIHVFYSRYTFIKLGKPADLKMNLKQRCQDALINVFGQKKLLKDKKSGIMHIVMFYGFIVLQLGAVELIVKGLIKGWEIPIGDAHKYFSLIQECCLLLILMAVGYAFYRRYIEKLSRLKRGLKAGIVLLFIAALMLSVLFSLAFEHLWLEVPASGYSPISSLLAMGFSGIGSTAASVFFYLFWWSHLLILLAFAVYVPQSKHAHLIFAPINIFLKKPDPPKLDAIDFEDESLEEYGVGKIENFKQNQLIDLYACVECGRCTDVCPASGTGKSLSPMNIMTKLRDHLTERGASITSRTPWMPAFAFANTRSNQLAYKAEPYDVTLVGDVITEEELWACTTCRNCEDACPVANEHVDKIVDMRRHLVMSEANMPGQMTRTFQNIERQGNPWGLNRKDRINWRAGMEEMAPLVTEVEDFEYLFFVGSMGSYDNRSMNVVKATATLLSTAGIKFAILGNEEKNSGDTVRRMGNEFLFQQLAKENIQTFQKYNVTKIVTACPHTYNVFKNEYPDFGLEAEVVHHSQLLYELVRDGKLKPTKEVKERITYHDSCYLGRYNQVYEPPREILKAIPGVELVEMQRNRSNSMCCGAGGGLMWMEETEGKRINIERTEQALTVEPTVIGSACPYCLTMMSDGVKNKEADHIVQTLDIAEILMKAV